MHIEFKDDAKWLSKFKIDVSSNSNKLYNNGSQQLKVTVSLTPVKGERITDEQMDRIWLFLIKDGSDHRDLGIDFGRGAYDPAWAKNNPAEPEELFRVSTIKDPRFEYFAAAGFAPQNLTASAPRSRDFYVSTLAPGGERYKIYAGIVKEDGVDYATSTSRFNSYVELEAISFPRRRRTDFTLERVHAFVGSTDDDKTEVDIDVYYLEFKDRGLRIVDAIPLGADENNHYYDDWRDADPFVFTGTHYTEIQRHYAFKPGAARHFNYQNASAAVNNRPGAMSLLRLELIGPANLTPRVPATGPTRWIVLDQYGTEHFIEMTQKNSGNEIDFRMFDV
jgi:hypothetical protein